MGRERTSSRSLAAAAILVALALLPAARAAQAELYAELYGGLVHGVVHPEYTSFARLETGNNVQLAIKGIYEPHVQGGLKLGTWFVPEGALGFNYPGFMKYFGFYLDFSYHRLNYLRTQRDVYIANAANTFPVGSARTAFNSEGTAATLAFMFAGRLNLRPSAEYPYGRVQPYLAVGPALMFTSQSPKWQFIWGLLGPLAVQPNSDSAVVPALAVETGVRFMALKNVSLDASFKYRFAQPSFAYHFRDPVTGFRHSFTLSPTYHLLSGQLGVAYHF